MGEISSDSHSSYSSELLEQNEIDGQPLYTRHAITEADGYEMRGVLIQGDEFSRSGNFHPHRIVSHVHELVVPGHRPLWSPDDEELYHPLLQRPNYQPALPMQEVSYDARRSVLVTGVQRRVQVHLPDRERNLQDRPSDNSDTTVQQEQTPFGRGERAERVVQSQVNLFPLALLRSERAHLLTARNDHIRRRLQRYFNVRQVQPQHTIAGLVDRNSDGTFVWKIPGVAELLRTKNTLFSPQFYTVNGYVLKASIRVVSARDPTEDCIEFIVRVTHKGNPLERPNRLLCTLLDHSTTEPKHNLEASMTDESSTSGHLTVEFKISVRDRELLNVRYVRDNKMFICFKT